jgi:hypothetical protein
MSRDFRPVVETWGSHSACFVQSDDFQDVLASLACAGSPIEDEATSDTPLTITGYGEYDVVWIARGDRFLDYVDSKTVDELISENGQIREMDDVDDVRSLLGNIKALSPEWRKLVDPKGGALRFYVDQE